MERPARRPARPFFSSGPAAKRPGWSPAALTDALVGRSHRSAAGRARLAEVIERSRRVFEVPDGHRVAIVPGSDTGAVEMALWSLLGARPVCVLAWESFGRGWLTDVTRHLRLDDVQRLEAEYGHLPELAQVDWQRDVVFPWNGTTSGVIIPDGDWIAADRAGLTICDATSAAGAVALPWPMLDVVTWSWQKLLGGEAAHGILVLGPRAAARLEEHTPEWPLPKVFRLTKKGVLNEALFRGDTINTPSMLCVEDALDALRWAESIGGTTGLMKRTRANFEVVARWVAATPWVDFLAAAEATRSPTSICLQVVEPAFRALSVEEQRARVRALASRLAGEGVAFDIESYRDAPPGLRLWGGATVDTEDLEALLPWLEWAWEASAGGGAPA